jgi:hypothetical protein
MHAKLQFDLTQLNSIHSRLQHLISFHLISSQHSARSSEKKKTIVNNKVEVSSRDAKREKEKTILIQLFKKSKIEEKKKGKERGQSM